MYVRTGLSSYAKSLELLACNGGIDCSWEVAYSANFLTETKLTADFESLRQLEKPAITRDINVPSPQDAADLGVAVRRDVRRQIGKAATGALEPDSVCYRQLGVVPADDTECAGVKL